MSADPSTELADCIHQEDLNGVLSCKLCAGINCLQPCDFIAPTVVAIIPDLSIESPEGWE